MAISTYCKVGITAMGSAVPKTKIDNTSYQVDVFGEEYAAEVVDVTGIRERRFTAEGVTASDLACAAAENMLSRFDIDRESIDILIFCSESPDYKFPHTASTLQHRLGLSTGVMAFDMPTGCTGSIYALSVASSLLQEGIGQKKALVLFAETHSRSFSPEDRSTAFLFGDGASCVLLEANDECGKSYFDIGTNGAKSDLIKYKAGGARNPICTDSDFGEMAGGGVFQLVIAQVPKNIKSLLSFAGLTVDDIDFAVFHQANLFMIKHLAKKLKFPSTKVPTTIERFGNVSSASVPLTMTECIGEQLKQGRNKILISAFGTGMTWGAAIFEVNNCRIAELVEI